MRHRIPDNEAGERRRETTMASIQERLKRLENQGRFLQWLQFERFLEGLTDAQLEAYTRRGRLPQPLPEPLPKGASRLDVALVTAAAIAPDACRPRVAHR